MLFLLDTKEMLCSMKCIILSSHLVTIFVNYDNKHYALPDVNGGIWGAIVASDTQTAGKTHQGFWVQPMKSYYYLIYTILL